MVRPPCPPAPVLRRICNAFADFPAMAAWIAKLVEQLAADPVAGYLVDQSPATEVVALSALAFSAHGRDQEARIACDWLAEHQSKNGSLSAREGLSKPCWPTSLATLAWQAVAPQVYEQNVVQSTAWMLTIHGTTMPNGGPSEHDTTLAGWPWVDGTHSWLEPTAWALLALRSAELEQHPRSQEAAKLLLDRTLAGGGCNYGNTVVLGQELRPHVEPTGLAMLALAGLSMDDPRMDRSLEYLATELRPRQGTASVCFATFGLAAHDRLPRDWQRHVQAAARRTLARDKSPHKIALLALAATGIDCPLVPTAAAVAGSRT